MAKTIRKSDKRNDNQNFINNHSKYYFLIVSFNFYSFVYGFFYSCSQTRIGILCVPCVSSSHRSALLTSPMSNKLLRLSISSKFTHLIRSKLQKSPFNFFASFIYWILSANPSHSSNYTSDFTTFQF